MKLHGCAEIVKRGADIQDLSAMLLELVESSTRDIEGAFQIDVYHRTKAVGRKLLGLTEKIAGRAVHHNINFAEVLDGGCDGILNFSRVTDVGSDREGFSAAFIYRCSRWFEMIHLPAHQRHRAT